MKTWSDTDLCGVWSGAALFTYLLKGIMYNSNYHTYKQWRARILKCTPYVSSYLDPVHVQQNVGRDLGPNLLKNLPDDDKYR